MPCVPGGIDSSSSDQQNSSRNRLDFWTRNLKKRKILRVNKGRYDLKGKLVSLRRNNLYGDGFG